MDIDSKCYECIAGAGLEPILSGGRGQASGFIMRMMAENKKKHQGQYKNPSNNDYGSTMKKFAEFDYKKLANEGQKGRNQSNYGASPFILKHFGSPEAVPFVRKSERVAEEEVEGETDEQKAARLQAKSEELAQLAKDLLKKSVAKEKVKGFLKGKVLVKKAKALLTKKKGEKQAEVTRKQAEVDKKADNERKRQEMIARDTARIKAQMKVKAEADPKLAAALPKSFFDAKPAPKVFNKLLDAAKAPVAQKAPPPVAPKAPAKAYQYPVGHPRDFAGRPIPYSQLAPPPLRDRR